MIDTVALSTEGGITISEVTHTDHEGNLISISYSVSTFNGVPKFFDSLADAEDCRESLLVKNRPEPPEAPSSGLGM